MADFSQFRVQLYLYTFLILIAVISSFEQQAVDGVDSFCRNLTLQCPYLASPTAHPLASEEFFYRFADGTVDCSLYDVVLKFNPQRLLNYPNNQQEPINVLLVDSQLTLGWKLPRCANWNDQDRLVANGVITEKQAAYKSPIFPARQCLIPTHQMWLPLVDVADFGFAKVDKSMFVRINSDGSTSWQWKGLFPAECESKLWRFPFDIMTCTVSFSLTSLDYDTIRVTHHRSNLNSSHVKQLQSSPQKFWHVTDFQPEQNEKSHLNKLYFTVRLQRNWQVYIFSIFSPLILLIAQQLSVFLMPAVYAGRSSLSFLAFLTSMIVFVWVNSIIPLTSDKPLILQAFSIQLAIGLLVTMYTLLSNRLMTNNPEKFGAKVYKLLQFIDLIDYVAFLATLSAYAITYGITFHFLVTI